MGWFHWPAICTIFSWRISPFPFPLLQEREVIQTRACGMMGRACVYLGFPRGRFSARVFLSLAQMSVFRGHRPLLDLGVGRHPGREGLEKMIEGPVPSFPQPHSVSGLKPSCSVPSRHHLAFVCVSWGTRSLLLPEGAHCIVKH